jgi:predicted phage tail protein
VSVNGAPAATTATPGATLTGLPLGRPLTVSVTATNAAGTSPAASAAPFTLTAEPGAPAIGRVTSGKRGGRKTIKVTWSAPADTGGTPITGYQVQVLKKSGKLVRTVGLAASRTFLKATFRHRGKYRFVVVAVNAVGAGPPSAPSKAVAAR